MLSLETNHYLGQEVKSQGPRCENHPETETERISSIKKKKNAVALKRTDKSGALNPLSKVLLFMNQKHTNQKKINKEPVGL